MYLNIAERISTTGDITDRKLSSSSDVHLCVIVGEVFHTEDKCVADRGRLETGTLQYMHSIEKGANTLERANR